MLTPEEKAKEVIRQIKEKTPVVRTSGYQQQYYAEDCCCVGGAFCRFIGQLSRFPSCSRLSVELSSELGISFNLAMDYAYLIIRHNDCGQFEKAYQILEYVYIEKFNREAQTQKGEAA